MNVADLSHWLTEQEASDAFVEICDDLMEAAPEGFGLKAETWDIMSWVKKIGNSSERNLYFGGIRHQDLNLVCKLWVLHARLTGNFTSKSAYSSRVIAIESLSHVLGSRAFKTLKTDDFNTAEKWLCEKYKSPYRIVGFLQQASNWLSVTFNLRLDYKNRLVNPVVHGRYGTDEGREGKLVPGEIIRDILHARHRDDLIAKDRFFLSVLAITIGAGFRVGELASLPAECLLKINGKLHMLHHPEKGGKPVPRPIHPILADVVEDAVNKLIEETKEARAAAKKLRSNPRLDWTGILNDSDAFRYFTAKWAHEWTSNPNHLMINPNGAWYTKEKRFVDALSAYEAAGRSKRKAANILGSSRQTFSDLMETQSAARRGELPPVRNDKARGHARKSWDTDQRVLSIMKLEEHCGTALKQNRRDIVRDIIDEAQSLQLQGKSYPAQPFDGPLEERFRRYVRPLLKDKNGNTILHQDEALLIVQKYALSEQRGTKEGDFSSITEHSFSRWLAGESRSLDSGNTEDSVFSRLGIVDPRTGKTAKFTSHDIRHWLNTIYQNGGLTEDQIALIFNRKYKKQNSTYDQTTGKQRTARLKAAVRDKIAVGQVAESYNVIADYSRTDAEEYLSAVLRMVNPMPHGVCTLDWATTPCPHHLSCFSCNDEMPCEHLIIEASHESSVTELKCIQREADMSIAAISTQGLDDSPTFHHFKRISRNVSMVLEQIQLVNCIEEEKDDGIA
ncbi:MAG: hypothetical protein Q7L19_10200 [Pseudohongiella sp.]|nr:hypothetical protein [Pseudohongiella sp.]